MKTTKLWLSLLLVTVLLSICAVTASAAETTLLETLTAAIDDGTAILVDSGYCGTNAVIANGPDETLYTEDDYVAYDLTNVKWSVYTLDGVHYLYFAIDTDSENIASTAITSVTIPENSENNKTILSLCKKRADGTTVSDAANYYGAHYSAYLSGGWQDNKTAWQFHMWNTATVKANEINKIVVAENITALGNGDVFASMSAVDEIELPTTLTTMNSAELRSCNSLKTLYRRGETRTEGTLNFSGFTVIPFSSTYTFDGLYSVENYVWGDKLNANSSLNKSTSGYSTFCNNKALKTLTLPDCIKTIKADCFVKCSALETVVLPSALTSIAAKAFNTCAALTEVTVPDVDIPYDSTATDIAGFTAANSANTFYDCPSLRYLSTAAGTASRAIALKFDMVPEDEMPPEADPTVVVASGYCINNSQQETDIKYEYYNVGTLADPVYHLYFKLDTEATDKVASNGVIMAGSTSGGWVTAKYLPNVDSNLGGTPCSNSDHYKRQAYYRADIDVNDIKKVVIGDNITQLGYSTSDVVLAGLIGLETVEIPASLTVMMSPSFKSCARLSTMYVRGNTPEEGTLEFSGFTRIPFNSPYCFAGLASVVKYNFPAEHKINGTKVGMSSNIFYRNDSLVELRLPKYTTFYNGAGSPVFYDCAELKTITIDFVDWIPLRAKTFCDLPSLEEIIFLNNPGIAAENGVLIHLGEGAEATVAGYTSATDGNTFYNCPKLIRLTSSNGSKICAFACEVGFDDIHTTVKQSSYTDVWGSNGTKKEFKIDTLDYYHNNNSCVCTYDYYQVAAADIVDGVHTPGTETLLQSDEYKLDKNGHFSVNNLYCGSSFLGITWGGQQIFGVEGMRDMVKTAQIGAYEKIQGWSNPELLGNMPNLVSVKLDTGDNGESCRFAFTDGNALGAFQGCSSLTTVWSGPAGEEIPTSAMGTIDLSKFSYHSGDYNDVFYTNLFNGCSSAERIILRNDGAGTEGALVATTFEGCTNLKYIEIPENITNIAADTFAACSSLNTIEINSASQAETKLFPDKEGVIILCPTVEIADDLNESKIYTYAKALCFGETIKSTGYGIRLTKTENATNGLRNLFSFDNSRFDDLTDAGLTFVEYGAMLIAADRLGNGELVLINNGEEYVPSMDKAVKIGVAFGTAEDKTTGKLIPNVTGNLLSKDVDKNADTSDFAVTLINYKSNWDSDVYAVGYSVFTDEAGNEYFDYAQHPTLPMVSIYDLAVGMYTNTSSTNYDDLINTTADEEAVWNVLYQGSRELEASNHEITIDSGAAMMIVSEDENGEMNLFVRTADGSAPTEAQMSEASAKAASLGITLANSVGIKIKDDPDFVLKTGMQLYIDAKLEAANLTATEKARSFIFITDNHDYEHNANKNVGLRTALVDYTRKQLGFKTVVHGGDIYDQFSQMDDQNDDRALEVFNRYVRDELYGTFGTDILYTVGNHDGNLIGWRHAIDPEDAKYVEGAKPEDYFLSEDLMYGASVANLGDKVKYDEEGIRAIKLTMEHYGITDEKTIEAGIGMIKMHYYWDDTENKTRYIVLDTGANGLVSLNFLNLGYTNYLPVQLKWFADTLYDVKTNHPDYNVVISGHQMSGDSANTMKLNASGVFAKFDEAIAKFKAGGTFEMTTIRPWIIGRTNCDYDGVLEEPEVLQNPVFVTFVDALDGNIGDIDITKEVPNVTIASIDFGTETYKKTVLTIGGHCHSDNAFYKYNYSTFYDTKSDPNNGGAPYADVALEYEGTLDPHAFLYITTGTCTYSHAGSAIDNANYGYDMNSTFPDSVRFDVVTIKDDGSVRLTRIGYGEDRIFDNYLPNK